MIATAAAIDSLIDLVMFWKFFTLRCTRVHQGRQPWRVDIQPQLETLEN